MDTNFGEYKRLLWFKAIKSTIRHGCHFRGPRRQRCTNHAWEHGALCTSTTEQIGDDAILIKVKGYIITTQFTLAAVTYNLPWQL